MKLGTNKYYYQMICKKNNNNYRKNALNTVGSFKEAGLY